MFDGVEFFPYGENDGAINSIWEFDSSLYFLFESSMSFSFILFSLVVF